MRITYWNRLKAPTPQGATSVRETPLPKGEVILLGPNARSAARANHRKRGRLPRTGGAIEPDDLVTVCQHLLDDRALAADQMGRRSNDQLSSGVAGQRVVLASTVTDAIDDLLLKQQHLVAVNDRAGACAPVSMATKSPRRT